MATVTTYSIYIYSIYKPYTTYKYIYICMYIYIQCVDIQCVQPRIKSSVPLDSPPESLLQAASETVAATATAAAHPWSAGVFSAPVRVGLGEEGYEMIYRSYIYIDTGLIATIFGTRESTKKHDLWHEGEHQKAQSRARFLARGRAPKSTI
jgi:hypothetical protein